MNKQAVGLIGVLRRQLAIVAIFPLLAGAVCVPKRPPPDKQAALAQELNKLAAEPRAWPARLQAIEWILHDTNPKSAALASRVRLDGLAITEASPECAKWVTDIVTAVAGQLVNGATHIDLGDYYCPYLPDVIPVTKSDSVVVFGFTSIAPRLPGAELKTATTTVDLTPDSILNGRVKFSLPQTCERKDLTLVLTGREKAKISINVTTVPEPKCAATAEDVFRTLSQGCNNDCCSVSSPEACVRDRCDAECANRIKVNPEGHPAIGDACATSGSYYKWCHSMCAEIDTCRRDWCDDEAPARKSCVAEAMSQRASKLAQCKSVPECGL